MQARVGQIVDPSRLRGLTVSTFHALGLEILREEHGALGYKKAMSIFDEHDRLALIKELLKHTGQAGELDQAERYAWQIGRWKNLFITPERALAEAGPTEQPAARLYAAYGQHMKAYNAVDFDDLILLPALLFQNDGAILENGATASVTSWWTNTRTPT